MKLKSAIRDKVVHELAKALQAKIAEGGSSPAFNRKFLFVKKVMAARESTAGSPLRVFSRGCTTGLAPKTQSGFTHRGSDKGPSPSLGPDFPSP